MSKITKRTRSYRTRSYDEWLMTEELDGVIKSLDGLITIMNSKITTLERLRDEWKVRIDERGEV